MLQFGLIFFLFPTCESKRAHEIYKKGTVNLANVSLKDILLATFKNILAGDQWWPRTSGGRLRFAHAITHLLRHRFGHFVNSNK